MLCILRLKHSGSAAAVETQIKTTQMLRNSNINEGCLAFLEIFTLTFTPKIQVELDVHLVTQREHINSSVKTPESSMMGRLKVM